ncbi:MAG: transposase [Planctomycetota bacterium]|nr:transposase [Planctomycetota bacterium]
MAQSLENLTVDEAFFEPALRLLRHYCRHRRETPTLSAERFMRESLRRVLGHWDSGRDFLQARQDDGEDLARATWFGGLHSRRRADLVAEVATRSYELFDRFLQPRDWLREFPELVGRAVWAVDGHQIEHASHAGRDPKDALVSVGLLYGLCLHSGLQRALGPFQGDGVRRHEWPVFKQHLPSWLAQDRGGLLPIGVGHPANIEVRFWFEQKRRRQAVIITREKENMKPLIISPNAFDPHDPVNQGVEADELAGYTDAHMRRIVYRDPLTGERFVFITTETTLRPGLLALLYFLRWKIEKVFDVAKNKLHQQKAWANGDTAAHLQAHCIALTHNLLTILLATLEQAGVRERKVERKQAARRKVCPEARRVPAQEMIPHAAQLTCQFIRLVRYYLDHQTPWRVARPRFQLRLEAYL